MLGRELINRAAERRDLRIVRGVVATTFASMLLLMILLLLSTTAVQRPTSCCRCSG